MATVLPSQFFQSRAMCDTHIVLRSGKIRYMFNLCPVTLQFVLLRNRCASFLFLLNARLAWALARPRARPGDCYDTSLSMN